MSRRQRAWALWWGTAGQTGEALIDLLQSRKVAHSLHYRQVVRDIKASIIRLAMRGSEGYRSEAKIKHRLRGLLILLDMVDAVPVGEEWLTEKQYEKYVSMFVANEKNNVWK